MSAIGLGTWQFGSKDWGYGSQYADVEAGHILERALDLGINVIDTAEIYGRGNSSASSAALGDRRKEAFVATKVLPIAPTANYVEKHGRKSAERLGIDVIDLYQIHWPNPVVPIAQQMEGMRRLQKAGVVIDVGVSNFSLARWRAAEDALGSPVLSNQVQYSLVARKPDAELVPYAQANERIVIAYSPLGMGLLSGRYDSSNPPTGSARLNNPLFLPESLDRAAADRDRARRRRRARRDAGAGRARVGDQPRQRGRDPGRAASPSSKRTSPPPTWISRSTTSIASRARPTRSHRRPAPAPTRRSRCAPHNASLGAERADQGQTVTATSGCPVGT